MTPQEYKELIKSKKHPKKRRKQEEKKLSHLVAEFITTSYPGTIHRFDLAADMKISLKQAGEIKNGYLHEAKYPDLFIAEPKGKYHGLYIELKKGYSEVFKIDGSYKKSEHIQGQAEFHKRLRSKGYCVEWGLGYEDAVKKICEYMGIGKVKENPKQGVLI